MTSKFDISALIGSRICHDLISPIGAIGNGLELLSMSTTVGKSELALLTESVGNANARIRFFRVAFGIFSAEQMMSAREIRSILSDLFTNTRLSVDWTISDAVPRQDVKLAFLLLLCLETAMPWGGQITISEHQGAIAVTGVSDKLKLEDVWFDALISGDIPDQMQPARVQFALVPLEVAERGRSLSVRRGENRIGLAF